MVGTKYLAQFSTLRRYKPIDVSSSEYQKFASEMDRTVDIRLWNSVCHVTLTLKQALGSFGRRVSVDEHQCRKAFHRFMGCLNRAAYGSAFRRYGKRLRVIPVLEKEIGGRWHYHAAIERPEHTSEDSFEALIRDCWSKTEPGYNRISVGFEADQGWIDYMLKPRQKSGLEAWSDCIDWNSFHNPFADA